MFPDSYEHVEPEVNRIQPLNHVGFDALTVQVSKV
jgi:hypothetical protein